MIDARKMLAAANGAMVVTLLCFLIAAYFAWIRGDEFPLRAVAVMHMLQIVFAGLFKLSYVLRLIAQKELGLALH